MPEFGSYDTGLDKYKKTGLDKDEDDSEIDHEDRDTLIQNATEAFDAASGNISTELKETFQQILDSTETYYDTNAPLAAETLEALIPILEQFADLTDAAEAEEKEGEMDEEIGQLSKMAARLEGAKKPGIQ